MKLFEKILKTLLTEDKVSVEDVTNAIDNHNRIIINYHSKGEDKNTGARVIEVYAYGLTKAGNPVLRAFQPFGDTTSRVPSWKFFRLDRISVWQPTKQIFDRPADFYYKNLGEFNPNGDETMSVVYKIASFGNDINQKDVETSQPKTKEDVYKTDTEHRMDRLKQQMENPIYLSDIKKNDAFKQLNQKETDKTDDSGPKTKDDVYKTDTERRMERLKQQMDNPVYLDSLTKNGKANEVEPKEEQPKDMDNQVDNKEDIYKTDTERRMERLRQQMENPQKIDLSKFRQKNRFR